MKNKVSQIPILPLNVVLFPHAYIKIHIFEEKYKTLYYDCISSNKYFGISLVIEDKIFNIGCLARIIQMEKSYENGSFDIIVKGTHRFKLTKILNTSKAYLVADAEYFEDVKESLSSELQNDTLALYDELVRVIYKEKVDTLQIPKVIKKISFKVAEKIGMTLLERQNLLEMTSETQRLLKIFDYLKEIMPRLEDFNVMQNIIQNDGYLSEQRLI